MNCSKSLWKAFLRLLGPMMLSNVVQALSSTINSMYVGRLLGPDALAAVSSFIPILFVFLSFIIGLAAGASVLVGQAYGANDLDKIRSVSGTAFVVTVAVGLLVAIAGNIFANSLLVSIGTPANILGLATSYAQVMFIQFPGIFVFVLITAMLRGTGDTVTPLFANIASTLFAVVMTPALIHGWLGLPSLGVRSGAYVGLFSSTSILLCIAIRLYATKSPLIVGPNSVHGLRIDPRILTTLLRIGVPSGLQMVVASSAELMVLFLVNRFGSDATAAYGAVNQVVRYVQFTAIAVSLTTSTFGAQAVGAGRADQMGKIAQTGLLLSLAITGGIVAFVYVFSHGIIGFFVTDSRVVELAHSRLNLSLWSYVVFGAAAVVAAVMRGSGTVVAPTIIAVISIIGIELPVAYLLSRRFGLDGIWISYPVGFIGMFAMMAAYYHFVWQNKPLQRVY